MKASRTCAALGAGDRVPASWSSVVEARRLRGEDLSAERLAVAECVEAREVEALVEVHARVARRQKRTTSALRR